MNEYKLQALTNHLLVCSVVHPSCRIHSRYNLYVLISLGICIKHEVTQKCIQQRLIPFTLTCTVLASGLVVTLPNIELTNVLYHSTNYVTCMIGNGSASHHVYECCQQMVLSHVLLYITYTSDALWL